MKKVKGHLNTDLKWETACFGGSQTCLMLQDLGRVSLVIYGTSGLREDMAPVCLDLP